MRPKKNHRRAWVSMLLFVAILLSLTSFGVRAQDALADDCPEATAEQTLPQETLGATVPETGVPQETTVPATPLEVAPVVSVETTLPDIQETTVLAPEGPEEGYTEPEQAEAGPTQQGTALPLLSESQRFYVGKNYTDAAPFLAPVAGATTQNRRTGGSNPDENGLELKKTAETQEDGSVALSLEAYVTGESISSVVQSDVPTDIILVLDQSGSMRDPFGYQFRAYSQTTNTNYYSYNNRNNLWALLEDGSYIQVSLQREAIYEVYYSALTGWRNSYLYGSRENLYMLQSGSYEKVRVERSGNGSSRRTYRYYNSSNNVLLEESTGDNTVPANLYYTQSQQRTGYRYTYRYALNGEAVTLRVNEVLTGGDDEAGVQLYARDSSSISRLDALTAAITGFADAVVKKTTGADGVAGTEDDVAHRIAMVGFASGNRYNGAYYGYANSEVFIGSREYTYGISAQGQYANALQDMRSQSGIANIAASIGALDADGGTLTHLGLEMANGILAANPVPAGEKRNRVVIVFTDGAPGWSGYDAQYAGSAITEAANTKGTYQATVYGVGIFDGADATSTGSASGTDVEKSNWFMQRLSSNDGVAQTPSYYLSAQDSKALQDIFEQISDQIEEGGARVKLDASTVLKDVISPYFNLPETGPPVIQLFTASYIAADTWAHPVPFSAGSVTVEGKTISVTGFDYAENWVGTQTDTATGLVTYRGQKLIVKIMIEPENSFFGGEQVPTNDGSSGIYREGDLFEPFPLPRVDVPLRYEIAAQNQSVYLSQSVDLSQLLAFVRGYRPNGVNSRFVTIEYTLMHEDTVIGTYTFRPGEAEGTWVWRSAEQPVLSEDTAYRLTCSVTSGALRKDGLSAEAKVFVFRPEITWQDQTIYLGEAPDYEDSQASLLWTGSPDAAAPVGPAPSLFYTYAPDAAAFQADTVVSVQSWIGKTNITQWTIFRWSPSADCTCDQKPSEGNFRVHVQACFLTITKAGSSHVDASQSYLFQVCGTDQTNQDICLEVAVVGNRSVTITGLPIGAYTVTEHADWSWRYTPASTWPAVLSRGNPSASIRAENRRTEIHWLDGCAAADNIFDFIHGGAA